MPEPEINPSDLGEWPERKQAPEGRAFDVSMLRDGKKNLKPPKARSPIKAAREVPSGLRPTIKAELLKNRHSLKAESPQTGSSEFVDDE
jgi:hypothetical protein